MHRRLRRGHQRLFETQEAVGCDLSVGCSSTSATQHRPASRWGSSTTSATHHWLAPVSPTVCGDDDLEKYLALTPETDHNLDLNVLAWWKVRDHYIPADPATGRPAGLPHLAKMARQYLGRPASSAGVERFFSMAGTRDANVAVCLSDIEDSCSISARARVISATPRTAPGRTCRVLPLLHI